MIKIILQSLKMFLWMTLITGIVYPSFVTVIGHLAMQNRVSGSIISAQGHPTGALLLAQKFESDQYFWPRPSAVDYNPLPSGGSNFGPTSAVLKKLVEERRALLAKAHEVSQENVPNELLFASGSGLDPHISPQAAYFQIARIVKARRFPVELGTKALQLMVDNVTERRCYGFLGQPVVNVLLLNMVVDRMVFNEQR